MTVPGNQGSGDLSLMRTVTGEVKDGDGFPGEPG